MTFMLGFPSAFPFLISRTKSFAGAFGQKKIGSWGIAMGLEEISSKPVAIPQTYSMFPLSNMLVQIAEHAASDLGLQVKFTKYSENDKFWQGITS